MLTKTVPAMNIAVISVDAMPTLGGVSSMAHHLANAFSRQGHETVFVGPRGSYVPGDQERLYHLYDDFRSNRKFLSAQDIIEEDLRIGSLLRDLFARYRIDHVLLAHPFHYGVMAVEIGGEMDIPVSALFHGFEIRSQLAEGYPRNLAKIISERRVETLRDRAFYVIGKANELIANSTYTKHILEGFNPSAPIHVSGCGAGELLHGPVIDGRVPGQIVYVGRLVENKRVDRLIDIVAASDALSAVIIGEGPERDKLQKKASVLPEGKVVLTGAVDEARKWQYLARADAVALLSEPNDDLGQVEGFGIALLEATMAGCIAVSSGTGGMTDVVTNDETGIILAPHLSAKEAASRLLSRLSSAGQRQAMLGRAREQIETRYNWNSIARQMTVRWQQEMAGRSNG